MYNSVLLIVCLGFFALPLKADVHINEFLAANVSSTGLRDEDGDLEGWIEIHNSGDTAVTLEGWSLTDNLDEPSSWVFPNVSLQTNQYLIVFASGKDRKPATQGGKLHTNFQLKNAGEYLGLYHLAAGPAAVSELRPAYAPQRNDYSYGLDSMVRWVYFQSPTPGAPNGDSPIGESVGKVKFSVKSGVFESPFTLELTCTTAGATIHYTTDGSQPDEGKGEIYTQPLFIGATAIIRAAAFKPNSISSPISSHTYLFGLDTALQSLPIVSLHISPGDLTGPTGIIGIKGGKYVRIDNAFSIWKRVRAIDYFNPSHTGIAWERPASAELLSFNGQDGFKIDCGIRVHGSESSRLTYHPDSKIPFGLFFRGRYGESKLKFPLIPERPANAFDSLVLRAGHNDPENPFITDELMRRLFAEMGHPSPQGTFVNCFINGQYKGYYNLTERMDQDWARAWYGGKNDWDVITPYSIAQEGDTIAWWALLNYATSHDLSEPDNYREIGRRLDLANFIDYLLLNVYGNTQDWTSNNWQVLRERVEGGTFRFTVWDAEQSLGIFGSGVENNTLVDPRELGNTSETSTLYHRIRDTPEFKLLFADRIQKHFFDQGALTDENILKRFNELKLAVSGVIPNMKGNIPDYWVPQRRGYVLQYFGEAGFLSSVPAPSLNQQGGKVPRDFKLSLGAPSGQIFCTLDGTDPRVPFSGKVSSTALLYRGSDLIRLNPGPQVLKARTLQEGAWSALTEATFEVEAQTNSAPDPPRVEIVKSMNDTLLIRFEALPGLTYSILYRDSATSGEWLRLGDIPLQTTPATSSFTLPLPSTSLGFYRVMVAPQP